MRVGSLFSGIGGIELGLERAGGFETVWFVENDPHAQAILRKHWPNATIYDDVTTVDFTTIPRIDVLTGGFPCQDISNAGKGAGITGSRSSLWKHCVRAVRYLRPRLAVFENVSALTRRGLDAVLCDLAAIGYDAEWHCIPAAAIGAPHRRDRIIILAYPNGERQLHGQIGEFANQGGGGRHSMTLGKAVRIWPTPSVSDSEGGVRWNSHETRSMAQKLRDEVVIVEGGGQLNPQWVEWLMGFPLGWTELSDSEMPSSRNGRKPSEKPSKKPKGGE